MELRPNVEKKPQAYSEALRQRPETRQKSRFSIEPLEERIAPDKDKYGSGIGGSAGESDPSLGF